MKKKEAIMIFILITITVALAIVFIVQKNRNGEIKETASTDVEINGNVEIDEDKTSEANVAKEIGAPSGENLEVHEKNAASDETQESIVLTEIEDAEAKKEISGVEKFEKYEISNLSIYLKNGVSTIIGKIKNKSNETLPEKSVNIKVTDENGEEIVTMGAVFVELQPGGETELNTNVDIDITNATKITIQNNV